LASFLGIGDYGRSGPGVPKNQPQKSRFKVFFEIYFRKFWKLIQLNLLYVICCIPVLTFGPATAAFTKILRNYSSERNAFLFSDFFETFKKNFKQSFFIGLADIILILSFLVSVPYYGQLASKSPAFVVAFSVTFLTIILFIMMNFYIYLLIVSTKLKIKDIIKNSFILALSQLKINLITLLIAFIVIAPVILFIPLTNFIMPFFPFSFVGLVICFNSYPVIRKFVIQPYYEQSGELNPDAEFFIEPKRTLFDDKGGKEKAFKPEKKLKGKVIK